MARRTSSTYNSGKLRRIWQNRDYRVGWEKIFGKGKDLIPEDEETEEEARRRRDKIRSRESLNSAAYGVWK